MTPLCCGPITSRCTGRSSVSMTSRVSIPTGITGVARPGTAPASRRYEAHHRPAPPSKGYITVLGERHLGNLRLYFRIGFCPEQDAFYDRMTGLEWVTALGSARTA